MIHQRLYGNIIARYSVEGIQRYLVKREKFVDYLWVLVLLILGICMVCYPKMLWKIENLFTVKNGEPTELYLVLMRIGGLFFIICSVGIIISQVHNIV